MMLTRLSLDGYGARRAGDFSGKTISSVKPVGILTRLSLDGYGAKRCGSFAGKSTEVLSNAITRLSLDAYGARRCLPHAFSGKTLTEAITNDYIIRCRRRGRR